MSSPHATEASSGTMKRSKFPQSFWVANTMEIFERLAWYGFFAVSSLYITGSRAEGALGFTSEQRGLLQGIIPFILYLLPVVFGALGDRFGYKKTFIVAYSVLVPAYYLLGQFTTFGTFFMSFLFVAVGAAIFKPVVVGTVARTTDKTNSSMGFGIFYMMVNVGGFIGPVVAGYVRVHYGWDWVFVASSFWIACNFIWLFVFYKEPTTESTSAQKRTLKQVFSGLVEVLGNGRFFIMVLGMLILLIAGGRNFSWGMIGLTAAGWIILNLLLDILLRARAKRGHEAKGLRAPMKVGNWKFALYLLILSGFWTSFNQIFLTHPEFIRDFVETRDIVNTARSLFGDNFARGLAAVNENLLAVEIGKHGSEHASTVEARAAALKNGSYVADWDTIRANDLPDTRMPRAVRWEAADAKRAVWDLYNFKVRVPIDTFAARMSRLPYAPLVLSSAPVKTLTDEFRSAASLDAKGASEKLGREFPEVPSVVREKLGEYVAENRATLDEARLSYLLGGVAVVPASALQKEANAWAEAYRQVNPEYIINVDAGAIVFFQVLVSFLIGFIPPLTAMVIGIIVAAIGIGMSAWTFTGWTVLLAITIFAFGEMMASPKSQEYVGRIAPQQKVAMYMGFYFWCVALGNIFGGRLSGELYGSLARDAGRPDIMWMIFGGLGLVTAVVMILYDRLIIGKGKME